jgi:hypothetical protein
VILLFLLLLLVVVVDVVLIVSCNKPAAYQRGHPACDSNLPTFTPEDVYLKLFLLRLSFRLF